jgi:hypothetical protein
VWSFLRRFFDFLRLNTDRTSETGTGGKIGLSPRSHFYGEQSGFLYEEQSGFHEGKLNFKVINCQVLKNELIKLAVLADHPKTLNWHVPLVVFRLSLFQAYETRLVDR